VTLELTDADGETASEVEAQVEVTECEAINLSIASGDSLQTTASQRYTLTVEADSAGGESFTFDVEPPLSESWLAEYDTGDQYISFSGTPETAGAYTLTVTATLEGTSCEDSADFRIEVSCDGDLVIEPPSPLPLDDQPVAGEEYNLPGSVSPADAIGATRPFEVEASWPGGQPEWLRFVLASHPSQLFLWSLRSDEVTGEVGQTATVTVSATSNDGLCEGHETYVLTVQEASR
jgi:hypothetical protein